MSASPGVSSAAVTQPAGQPTLRPALPAALGLMAGIFFHRLVPLPQHPLVLAGSLALLVLAAALCFRRGWLCSILLLAAAAVAGATLGQVEYFFYPRDHISAFAADQPRLAQLELYLDDPPRVLTAPYGQYRAMPPKQVVTASLRQVKTWTGWTASQGKVLVQIAQPHPRLR